MASPPFRALLTEALRQFADRGYTNEADLQDWLLRLRAALERELPTDEELRQALVNALGAVFARQVNRGGIQQRVPGVDKFTLDRIAPELRAELDRRIFAGIDLIKLNRAAAVEKTLQRFSGWISSAPPAGIAKPDLRGTVTEILKPIAQIKYERRRLATDQGHKLASAIAHTVAMGQGAIAAVWHDRGEFDHGYDARPEHLKRSGTVFLVKNSWALEDGLITRGSRAKYTDEIEQPAELPFCFPADTRVPFAEGVEVAYRRWYSGELTEIITASGKTLRATPNHPLLTPKGWVASGALKEGDYVIEIAQERVDRGVAKLDDDDAQPTIAQVHGSLTERGVSGYVRGSRFQFHGDGSEEDVDVVVSSRGLNIDCVSTGAQRISDFPLTKADASGAAARAFDLLARGGFAASARSMGLGDTGATPFGATALKMQPRSRADAPDYAANRDDALREKAPANADFGGQSLDRVSRFVAATKIVSVNRLSFAGHVYNLQTATGLYVANGIVAHNCSCFYEYVTSLRALPPEFLTAKGRAWLEWEPGRHHDAAQRRADSVPTQAQRAAGNYPKGHLRWMGLDISIETRKGEERVGIGSDGRPWKVQMPADYGYIRRTIGADDEQVDCYIGPERRAPTAWIVRQVDVDTGAYDEDKVLIRFGSRAEALNTYEAGFSDGRGAFRIGSVLEIPVEALKAHYAAA